METKAGKTNDIGNSREDRRSVVERLVIHFKDLDFTVEIKPKEYRVEYVIYDIEGYINGSIPGWHRAGSDSHPDIIENLEEAEPYLHGEVKWDGCSNWHFDEQDRVMLHGCSHNDLTRFGKVMGRCWNMTRKFCPKWL